MFHLKISLLSLKTRNSFSPSVSCKHVVIIIGREDGGLIKKIFEVGRRGLQLQFRRFLNKGL